MPSCIPTARRLEYVQGYAALGMLAEAAAELAAIPPAEASADAVLETRIDLHSLRAEWGAAVAAAREFVDRQPQNPKGWISWAYALRRHASIPDAERILLEADRRLAGSCALVHYNLACYRCQLGDLGGAFERLVLACRLEPAWKQAALHDPDLLPLRDQLDRLR